MKKRISVILTNFLGFIAVVGLSGNVYSQDKDSVALLPSEKCEDGVVWEKTPLNCLKSPTCPAEAWTPKYNHRTGRKVRCDEAGIKKENMINGIMDAIENSDCEALDKILQEAGIDIIYEWIDGFKGTLYFYMLSNEHNAKCLNVVLPYHPDLEMIPQEYYSKGETPLLYAAKNNAGEAVKLLIDAGADVNVKDTDGNNALYYAIRYNNMEMAEALIVGGIDYGSTQFDKADLFASAYKQGNTQIIKTMLSPKQSIDEKDAETACAVEKAVFYDDDDMMLWLLNHGLSADSISSDGYSLLERAIRGDKANIFKILLEHGADMNTRTKDGRTLLQCAVGFNRVDIAKLLAEHGAEIESEDSAPEDSSLLIYALKFEKKEAAQWLIEQGANINARDHLGRTALHLAVLHGDYDTAELLINHGADVNAVDNSNQNTPLMDAPFAAIGMAELLIEHGADVNARNKFGGTALSAAVGARDMYYKDGFVKLVEILLKNGADVNVKDNFGNTPLKTAVENGYDKIAELLRQYGAKEYGITVVQSKRRLRQRH